MSFDMMSYIMPSFIFQKNKKKEHAIWSLEDTSLKLSRNSIFFLNLLITYTPTNNNS